MLPFLLAYCCITPVLWVMGWGFEYDVAATEPVEEVKAAKAVVALWLFWASPVLLPVFGAYVGLSRGGKKLAWALRVLYPAKGKLPAARVLKEEK